MPRLATLALLVTLIAPPAAPAEVPFFGSWFSGSDNEKEVAPQDRPGGREWWRKNKKKAIFVPGQGYRVEGVEGFFDGSGVPITASIDEQTIRLNTIRDEGGGLLPGLDPKLAAKRVKEATGYGPDERVARALLDEGVALFAEQKYEPAATKFDAAAERWPGGDLAATALFNLGESYYFDDQFHEASDAYIKLLDNHPSTPRLNAAVERLWSIAQFWEQTHFDETWRAPFDYQPTSKVRPTFDTIGHAVRLYEAIRLNDPTGPRADDAIMATAGIHFRRNRFSDADYHYTLLRQEYPRSEHQFEAHVLGLQAKMRRYQGADYDGSVLEEAKRLEELTRINFSGRLNDEERGRLRDVRAQVAAAVEQRDLRMVEYYEGTDHIGAAKYYLARIIDEHPDSPAAEKAKEKLVALDGLPDTPDVPMEWLVDLFPENKSFEALNSIREVAPTTVTPDVGRTMIADESSAREGATTTR
ncbi:MAG: tetratricopeptide repeat protein [Planctomycetota bacterium]